MPSKFIFFITMIIYSIPTQIKQLHVTSTCWQFLCLELWYNLVSLLNPVYLWASHLAAPLSPSFLFKFAISPILPHNGIHPTLFCLPPPTSLVLLSATLQAANLSKPIQEIRQTYVDTPVKFAFFSPVLILMDVSCCSASILFLIFLIIDYSASKYM